jgi:hypothetical protein
MEGEPVWKARRKTQDLDKRWHAGQAIRTATLSSAGRGALASKAVLCCGRSFYSTATRATSYELLAACMSWAPSRGLTLWLRGLRGY